MLLPFNINNQAGHRYGTLVAVRCLLVLGLAFMLGACGYGFAGKEQTILGDPSRTIMVKGVENPTMHTWLGFTLRSTLRDELGARNIATWVDSGPADYSIYLKVHEFTLRSSVRSLDDATLLFDGMLKLEAIIYQESDNAVVWNSGVIGYADSFESNSPRAAGEILSTQLINRIVGKMRSAF